MDEKRPQTAERIDEYIRIGSPGIIAMIVALFLVFAAVIYWGFTGKLHETESFRGIVDISEEGEVCVFVNADLFNGQQMVEKPVEVKMEDRSTSDGSVVSSSASPFTEDELAEAYGYSYWEMKHLVTGVYSYIIEIDTEKDLSDYQGQLVEVSVIMNEVSPISFLIGGDHPSAVSAP